jgi:hypothetical protein
MCKSLLIILVIGGASCMADVAAIRAKLQSALVETDETRLSITKFTESSADDIKDGTREELLSLLPIAQKCLQSNLKSVQEFGLRVFYLTTFRPDSAELIAPYVDRDIAPFLNEKDLAVKREAILILGNTNPRLLPHALDLLAAHLADKNNTRMEAGMIAATLIHGRPSDAGAVLRVLVFVSGHPELKLRNNMIQVIGLNNVTTDEAIKYIREGLADRDAEVRRVAAEAVGHMPRENRATFSGDLYRLLADPNENSEVRATAQRVLQQ